MTPVAVIGLGAMGLGMAKTLAAKGFPVIGFDISPERRVLAAALGVQPVDDVRLALAAGEVIVTSLPTGAHVADIVEGEGGFLVNAKPGAVLVDTSTSEPATSRRLAGLCAAK